SGQNVRRSAHCASDQHGLARFFEDLRQVGMARAEGAGRALAMREEQAPAAVYVVLFDLASVVRNVIKKLQIGLRQNFAERPSDQMRDDLAVGQSAVDCGAHRAQILLADRRVDRRAGQLAVWQLDPVAGRARRHLLQELRPDLMAQPARAAVDADDDLVQPDAEGRSDLGVIDFGHALNFAVMIAGVECSYLLALAVPGARRYGFGTRALHPAALLYALRVLRRPVAAAHGPARAAGEHLVHLGVVQFDLSLAPYARRHLTEQRVGQLGLH